MCLFIFSDEERRDHVFDEQRTLASKSLFTRQDTFGIKSVTMKPKNNEALANLTINNTKIYTARSDDKAVHQVYSTIDRS